MADDARWYRSLTLSNKFQTHSLTTYLTFYWTCILSNTCNIRHTWAVWILLSNCPWLGNNEGLWRLIGICFSAQFLKRRIEINPIEYFLHSSFELIRNEIISGRENDSSSFNFFQQTGERAISSFKGYTKLNANVYWIDFYLLKKINLLQTNYWKYLRSSTTSQVCST